MEQEGTVQLVLNINDAFHPNDVCNKNYECILLTYNTLIKNKDHVLFKMIAHIPMSKLKISDLTSEHTKSQLILENGKTHCYAKLNIPKGAIMAAGSSHHSFKLNTNDIINRTKVCVSWALQNIDDDIFFNTISHLYPRNIDQIHPELYNHIFKFLNIILPDLDQYDRLILIYQKIWLHHYKINDYTFVIFGLPSLLDASNQPNCSIFLSSDGRYNICAARDSML